MNKKRTGFVARILMVAMLAFLALPTAVFAQGRDGWGRTQDRNRNWDWRNIRRGRNNNDGYDNYGGTYNMRQTALNAGFNDGVKEGRKDRSRGERFEFRDEGAFQSATRDFNSRFGNRDLYRAYYRQAFENGYRDGFSGY